MRTSLAIDELAAHCALSSVPEVWLDLVHGRVSAEEAAAASAEPEALVERSRVLFAPPSAEDEERRLQALLQACFPEPARRRRPWWLVGVITAVAAGLLLLLVPLRRPAPFEGGYAVSVSGGMLEVRAEPSGGAAAVERFREDQRIELRLRPREAVEGPIEVTAFATSDGRSLRLSVQPEINEHGVVVVAGRADALGLSAGRWTLTVVVGWADHLPDTLDEVHDDAEAPYDAYAVEVEIVSAPVPSSP